MVNALKKTESNVRIVQNWVDNGMKIGIPIVGSLIVDQETPEYLEYPLKGSLGLSVIGLPREQAYPGKGCAALTRGLENLTDSSVLHFLSQPQQGAGNNKRGGRGTQDEEPYEKRYS